MAGRPSRCRAARARELRRSADLRVPWPANHTCLQREVCDPLDGRIRFGKLENGVVTIGWIPWPIVDVHYESLTLVVQSARFTDVAGTLTLSCRT
jgi:hypothetical protein